MTGSSQKANKYGLSTVMTADQVKLYEATVDDYCKRDPERNRLLACYRVDYHIHLHYLVRRGMLNLCRDSNDMHSLREWQWNMSLLDAQSDTASSGPSPPPGGRSAASYSTLASEYESVSLSPSCSGLMSPSRPRSPFSTPPSSSSSNVTTTSYTGYNGSGSDSGAEQSYQDTLRGYLWRRARRWGWPNDIGLFKMYQTILWRGDWESRRQRERKARAGWSLFEEEQRHQGQWRAWRDSILRKWNDDPSDSGSSSEYGPWSGFESGSGSGSGSRLGSTY